MSECDSCTSLRSSGSDERRHGTQPLSLTTTTCCVQDHAEQSHTGEGASTAAPCTSLAGTTRRRLHTVRCLPAAGGRHPAGPMWDEAVGSAGTAKHARLRHVHVRGQGSRVTACPPSSVCVGSAWTGGQWAMSAYQQVHVSRGHSARGCLPASRLGGAGTHCAAHPLPCCQLAVRHAHPFSGGVACRMCCSAQPGHAKWPCSRALRSPCHALPPTPYSPPSPPPPVCPAGTQWARAAHRPPPRLSPPPAVRQWRSHPHRGQPPKQSSALLRRGPHPVQRRQRCARSP